MQFILGLLRISQTKSLTQITARGVFDSRRHMRPWIAAPWTLTSSTLDLDLQRQGTLTSSAKGPRLAAPMMRDLRHWLNLAVTRGTPSSQGTSTRRPILQGLRKYDIWEIYGHRRVLWTDSQQKFEFTRVVGHVTHFFFFRKYKSGLMRVKYQGSMNKGHGSPQ